MVTINGLAPAHVSGSKKAAAKKEVKKGGSQNQVAQATRVATAVSQSIRHLKESDLDKARIQYDLPEGHSRKAMEEYMDILNQAKKEELAQLIGVDIYI